MADRQRPPSSPPDSSAFRAIDPHGWDALSHGPGAPFTRHAFLRTFARTGCTTPATGWTPHPLVLPAPHSYERGHAPPSPPQTAPAPAPTPPFLAAAPAYLKAHSMGEFVYDSSWAHVAQRIGAPWYPKLIAASPFSPVTGNRLLTPAGLDDDTRNRRRLQLLDTLRDTAEDLRCGGAHVLFCTEDEARLAEQAGWLIVPQVQHHFLNPGFRSFDDWLDTMRSKRRRNIRRERRRLAEQGWHVQAIPGCDATPLHRDLAFTWYARTVDQFLWGQRYLNRDTFETLFDTMPDHILLLAAGRDGEQPVAGAFTFIDEHRIYGRYWGATDHVELLHFEVCYYALVEQCIERGLEAAEFGHGGEQKALRGFTPVRTWSAHFPFDPRMRLLLRNHFHDIARHVDQLVAREGEDGD